MADCVPSQYTDIRSRYVRFSLDNGNYLTGKSVSLY